EADLSRPTREKLDRLSEILNIPPETWAEIDAETEAANKPPDTSRPWKIATAALAVVCVVLAVCLTITLWPKTNVDVPRPAEDRWGQEPPEEDPIPEGPPAAPVDTSTIYPDILPVTLSRDFDFGDQPLGEYDPAEVPFLDDLEELQKNELAGFMFGDTANHGPGDSWCHLSIVKANTRTDERGTAFSDVYLLYALPDENGELDYKILFRMAAENHYVNADPGAVTVEPFFNVLGHDGFKVLITVGASGRWGFYLTQRPDGTPAMMTNTAGTSLEADVDEDGVLEIIDMWKNNPTWEITDTEEGQEGAFIYTLSTLNEDFPGALANLCFDPERGGFVVLSSEDTVLARYALQDGLIVRLPLTDFSALDYPDVAGTKVTFVPDVEILSDSLNPDELLPYTDTVRITHRQQAYLALQELYNLTGLKVDECYCTANEYGVLFSLLPDGFNQRSFFCMDFNTRYGNVDNIPSIHISWKELGNDWSPLSLADAVRPENWVEGEAEIMLWYYSRMKIFNTGEASSANRGDPSYANLGELWLENGDLYNYFMEETEYGPVLTGITGPYPGGEVNH
nr:hypothetical protein [Oscillospiraceae bacterium]